MEAIPMTHISSNFAAAILDFDFELISGISTLVNHGHDTHDVKHNANQLQRAFRNFESHFSYFAQSRLQKSYIYISRKCSFALVDSRKYLSRKCKSCKSLSRKCLSHKGVRASVLCGHVFRANVPDHRALIRKSNSARFSDFLLHTSIRFHEITPTNCRKARGKMIHIKKSKKKIHYLIEESKNYLLSLSKDRYLILSLHSS